MKFSGYLIFLCVTLAGCSDSTMQPAKNMRGLYFEYNIYGEEDKGEVTTVLRYHQAGPNGDNILIKQPGNVQLDGRILNPDSTHYTGIYYEQVKPVSSFSGKHSILYTSPDKKEYEQEFEFIPFTLVTWLPEKVKRRPFSILLNGIGDNQQVRVVMVDTSFATVDVNEMVVVRNNQLQINEQMLNALKNGPVTLELYKEEERPILISGKVSGRISITYRLKREFELTGRPLTP
jgi:hypothetical protein